MYGMMQHRPNVEFIVTVATRGVSDVGGWRCFAVKHKLGRKVACAMALKEYQNSEIVKVEEGSEIHQQDREYYGFSY